MRVTQSMLSSNMLRNLSASYNKMGKLQEQITSGKKVNRPSDDPVVVMKGMGYRMQYDKVLQFQRNLGEANNWLDNSDDALDKVGSVMKRIEELMVNASTDSMTQDDREKILAEIKQMREQVQDIANTKVGDRYIFSGTKTDLPPYKQPVPPATTGSYETDAAFSKDVEIEVFDGIMLKVNADKAIETFAEIDQMFADIERAIETPNDPANLPLDEYITQIQEKTDSILEMRADLGARQNRAEMMDERLSSLEVSSRKQMSENEDVEYEKAITEMITEESIHRAALSVGARIIQPSLVDFLR